MNTEHIQIRPTQADDIAGLQQVLHETGLFPEVLLPDMVAPALSGEADALWLTCMADGHAVGFCYATPEEMTEGTWNMLALAVHPQAQKRGFGAALVRAAEAHLHDAGHRILIVDTSGTDAFAKTRAFYAYLGYAEEARIRDFWADGDDKVIFRKAL